MGETDLHAGGASAQLSIHVPASSGNCALDFLGGTSLTLTHAMSPGLHDGFNDGSVDHSEPMSHKPGPSVGRQGHSLF